MATNAMAPPPCSRRHPGLHGVGAAVVTGSLPSSGNVVVIDGLTNLGGRSGAGVRHAGSPLRLPGVCSRVTMRSRCSGVSGGNESTMTRTCSVSTAACSRVAGSVMLDGGSCGVRTGFRECGSDRGELVVSVFGAVAVGGECSVLLRVLVVLSRCFEWFGLFVSCVFLSSGTMKVVGVFRCVLTRDLWQRVRNTRTGRPASQLVSVAASEPISSVAARSRAARMSAVR